MMTGGFGEPAGVLAADREDPRRSVAATSTSSTTTSAWVRGILAAAPTTVGRCSRRCTTRSPSTDPSRWITPRPSWQRYAHAALVRLLRMQVRVAKRLPAVAHGLAQLQGRHQRPDAACRSSGSPSCRSASTTRSFGPTTTSSSSKGRLMVTSSQRRADEGPRAAPRSDRQAARRARHRPHRHRPAATEGPCRARASSASDSATRDDDHRA